MAEIQRIRSTFAPKVCIGCHWEAKYHELRRAHVALRSNLMKAGLSRRRGAERIDDEEREETPDLVDVFHAHG